MEHHHGGTGSRSDLASLVPQPASETVSIAGVLPPMQPVETYIEELPGGGAVNSHNVMDDESGASEVKGFGRRWSNEETMVLIRIRSEMDAAFRNSALNKVPLWEEVSRRLAELEYHRSANKCKEKFENLTKYYKRTKEIHSEHKDDERYKFFKQLEALHASTPLHQHQHQTAVVLSPIPLSMALPLTAHPPEGLPQDLNFSSGSSSKSNDESDKEGENEAHNNLEGSSKLVNGGRNKKLMALFEGMAKVITDKQDAMLSKSLETLDKWEAERTAREEKWRCQELARINREREQHEIEQAAATSRNSMLMAFLQRVGGNSVLPDTVITIPTGMSLGTAPVSQLDASKVTSMQLEIVPTKATGSHARGESHKRDTIRWPKEEVQALIQLRMDKENNNYDRGPKVPRWEDISTGMQRMGYNRSSKQCKQKWENINKYFKKLKENKKRRSEDSKTCPYFHELDAIYNKKQHVMSDNNSSVASMATAATATAFNPENPGHEFEVESNTNFHIEQNVGIESFIAPPENAETITTTAGLGDITTKKAEDIGMVAGPNAQSQLSEFTTTCKMNNDMATTLMKETTMIENLEK